MSHTLACEWLRPWSSGPLCSDKLIEEATGGSAAAKSFRERDEKGFRESEVNKIISPYALWREIYFRLLFSALLYTTAKRSWSFLTGWSTILLRSLWICLCICDQRNASVFQTEVLKQLSSMGRLVVSAGNGAFQSPTNL